MSYESDQTLLKYAQELLNGWVTKYNNDSETKELGIRVKGKLFTTLVKNHDNLNVYLDLSSTNTNISTANLFSVTIGLTKPGGFKDGVLKASINQLNASNSPAATNEVVNHCVNTLKNLKKYLLDSKMFQKENTFKDDNI